MRIVYTASLLFSALAISCTADDGPTRFPGTTTGGSGGTAGQGGSGASGGSGAHGGTGAHGAGGPSVEVDCDAPVVAPSGGSCVTITASVECNPVTSEPCSEVCGNYGTGLFQCYTITSPQGLCGDCDDGVCMGTFECPDDLGYDGLFQCARYCCDDGDCGSGTCVKDAIATPDADVGICLSVSG